MLNNCKVIDLTLTLDEQFPCFWPTAMLFQKKKYNWYEKIQTETGIELDNKFGAYFTEWVMMDEHTGTHFDAPSHFIPPVNSGFANSCSAGMVTGDKANLTQLMGSAVVIDVTKLSGKGEKGESPYILPTHIQEWEQENGKIHSGEIVLLYSGWDKHYQAGEAGKAYAYHALITKEGPGWPAPHAETIKYLYQCGVRCVGTDGTSMGSSHDGPAAHLAGLSKGMLYVEALCNLDKLACRDSYFMFLPVKIAGSSGGPGRAIAFVPNS